MYVYTVILLATRGHFVQYSVGLSNVVVERARVDHLVDKFLVHFSYLSLFLCRTPMNGVIGEFHVWII